METSKLNIKHRIMIIAIVTAFVAAIAGFIVFSNSPHQRLKKQLIIGQKYLNEMDYEQAVAAFNEALDIDPNSSDASNELVSSLDMWSKALLKDDESSKEFIDAIKNVVIAHPDNQMLIDASQGYAEGFEEEDKYEEAIEIYISLNDVKKNVYSEKLIEINSERKQKAFDAELEKYASIFEDFKLICDENYYASAGNDAGGRGTGSFKTFSQRREMYITLSEQLENYIELLRDNSDNELSQKNEWFDFAVDRITYCGISLVGGFPEDFYNLETNNVNTYVKNGNHYIHLLSAYQVLYYIYWQSGEPEKAQSLLSEYTEYMGKGLAGTTIQAGIEYNRDEYGRVIKYDDTDEYFYDDHGCVTKLRRYVPAGLDEYDYEYQDGRIISMTNHSPSGSVSYTTYEYDGDLVTETIKAGHSASEYVYKIGRAGYGIEKISSRFWSI